MVSKIAVFCISAIFVQTIAGQCIGNPGAYGLAANGLPGKPGNVIGNGFANGYNGLNPTLSNGGCLQVTSSSPFAPTGIQILTELVIEGPLSVAGNLPLLGAVALEGSVPTGGQAGAAYGCGNGNIGITNEIGNGVNAGLNNIGYSNAGLANVGLANAGLANAGLANAGLANPGLGVNNGGLGCGRIFYS